MMTPRCTTTEPIGMPPSASPCSASAIAASRNASIYSPSLPVGIRFAMSDVEGSGHAPHGARVSGYRYSCGSSRLHDHCWRLVRHREVPGGPVPGAVRHLRDHRAVGSETDHRLAFRYNGESRSLETLH